MTEMEKESRIFVAGHRGLVGSAILRRLNRDGFLNLITADHQDLDLRDAHAVKGFFQIKNPEYVFMAAGKVGGIKANMSFPADFLYDNVMINTNVIHQSYLSRVKKLVLLGSSCMYPRECSQPMKEEHLLTGVLETTNEGYALAKILALKQAEYYSQQYGFKTMSLMPPNLYGPGDHFDLQRAHVMSALVKRFVDVVDEKKREITLWGTGKARREFMYVDDLVEAIFYFMENYEGQSFINVGWGSDISIKELADQIAETVGFKGDICWDVSMADGMLRKCMDVSLMKSLGFQPEITMKRGIVMMVDYYKTLKKGNKIQ